MKENADLPTKSFDIEDAKLLIDGKYRLIEKITVKKNELIIEYGEDITPANTLFVNSRDEFTIESTF